MSDALPLAGTPEPSDGMLAARAARGEEQAFRSLVDRYGGDCARYATRILGHRQDAEDAIQEAWWRAYRALPRYREREVFKRWLFRILVNVCRTMLKRRGQLRQRFVHDDDLMARAADASGGVSHAPTLDQLLHGLDARSREALLLKFGEDLAYVDMAGLTGDSVPALKMRVKRALEALRPALRLGP